MRSIFRLEGPPVITERIQTPGNGSLGYIQLRFTKFCYYDVRGSSSGGSSAQYMVFTV